LRYTTQRTPNPPESQNRPAFPILRDPGMRKWRERRRGPKIVNTVSLISRIDQSWPNARQGPADSRQGALVAFPGLVSPRAYNILVAVPSAGHTCVNDVVV
jgi:hypothetical protein